TIPGDYEPEPQHGGGGNGPGNTGDLENYDTPANMLKASKFLNKIDDSQLSPCMKAVLAYVKSLSNGSVATIIKKFSGTMPGYNWTIKDGTLPPFTNGSTNPLYSSITGTVTTIFDSQKFINGSDLAVARTILHESVHAYLVAYFKNDNATYMLDYGKLLDKWNNVKNASANDYQHDLITKNFVADIGIALKEYGMNRGYNLSDQFYQDLAWGGLESTNAFINLSNSDKNRIKDIIVIEHSGLDRFGNSQNKKGNNSGCN
ncbi:MAG: hypothetical protein WBP45_07215, partial [Daejeonella sp.]